MPLKLVDTKHRRKFCKTFIFDIQKNSYSTFYSDSKQRAGGAGIIN